MTAEADPPFSDGKMTRQPSIGPEAPAVSCSMPTRREHAGQSVRLVPLSPSHAPALWKAAHGADESWTYLPYGPFADVSDFERHVTALAARPDQPFFAVLPNGGEANGWISYCDVEPQNAAIEIGSIWFSPSLQRTRAATEALVLLLDHAFAIGCHRVAWRCNALNLPSRRAAERLGFVYEGTWRRSQIVKGRWRDTSWYARLADEWAADRPRFERWLADANFDRTGRQRSPLR